MSIAENFGWIEIAFVAVVALGFGFYQLWSVSREIEADKRRAEGAKKTSESADDAGHLVREHELDDR